MNVHNGDNSVDKKTKKEEKYKSMTSGSAKTTKPVSGEISQCSASALSDSALKVGQYPQRGDLGQRQGAINRQGVFSFRRLDYVVF